MKKKRVFLLPLLLFFGLFVACSAEENAASSSETSSPSSQPVSSLEGSVSDNTSQAALPETLVYRGEITELSENEILVTQLPGYDYGQEAILFSLPQESAETTTEDPLSLGMYVEVAYDGNLTRSIPPAGVADSVSVLAPFSDGVLWSGSIVNTEHVEDGYRIELQAESPRSELIILNVPFDALENLSEEELVSGTKVLAIGNGAMTASLPAQLPVLVLLPLLP